MSVNVVTYRITGISPLLMHSPKGMKEATPAATIGKKAIPSPEIEAEAGAYRMKDKQLYVPSSAFRKCMLLAARGRRIGKTSAALVLGGSVLPIEEETPLIHPVTAEPMHEYEIDIRRVVVQKQGVRRARPLIRDWACDLLLDVDLEMLPNLEILTQVLNIGGKMVGVLDNRVEKGGTNGRFVAELRNGNTQAAPHVKVNGKRSKK